MVLLGSALLTSRPAPPEATATIALPTPAKRGTVSLEEALVGRRSIRWLEAGCAGQNVYLEATALRLATVMVGAFDDAEVGRALGLAPEEGPLWLMPVGRRRG
ncbi:MAG TPA: nitroreductase family protein [Thermoanaerobaculia bacterium]|nr:nitroreductase family protein [Thermoanaerobaculia bacterium]